MSKLSNKEAGSIGGKIFSENCKIRKQEKENIYNQNPKLCPICNCAIPFNKHKIVKFCSRSCAATHNNSISPKRKIKPKNRKSLSQIIQERNFKVEQGLVSERGVLRKYLKQHKGYVCSKCSLTHWLGTLLSLELDHIDGNASNNHPSNLRFLCPNCHSITPTWKGRNKGYGRKSLGISLY